MPQAAKTWAMEWPMVPAPMTATRLAFPASISFSFRADLFILFINQYQADPSIHTIFVLTRQKISFNFRAIYLALNKFKLKI
jgi:hypothetical protein